MRSMFTQQLQLVEAEGQDLCFAASFELFQAASGAHHVALLDHHLLGQKDLFSWDFHPEVASRNHDCIPCLQYVIEVEEALLILHLADDLDGATLWAQHLSVHPAW